MDGSVADASAPGFYVTKQQMRESFPRRHCQRIPPEQYIQEINSPNLRELKKTIPGCGRGESS